MRTHETYPEEEVTDFAGFTVLLHICMYVVTVKTLSAICAYVFATLLENNSSLQALCNLKENRSVALYLY